MATALSIFAERLRKAYAAVGFGVRSSVTQADADVPTIKSGSAAPTATEPGGSLYMRTNGGLYTTAGGGTWVDPVASFADQFVTATITVPNVGAGGTDALMTLTLKRAIDHSTAVASARQVLLVTKTTTNYQYAPADTANASAVTFKTATTGTIISAPANAGWALVETSAAGAFACTVENTNDETLWVVALTADGVSDLATRCVVVGSNSDAATWSA
jgi:hypothetical protein